MIVDTESEAASPISGRLLASALPIRCPYRCSTKAELVTGQFRRSVRSQQFGRIIVFSAILFGVSVHSALKSPFTLPAFL